jgi:hypothetical protein
MRSVPVAAGCNFSYLIAYMRPRYKTRPLMWNDTDLPLAYLITIGLIKPERALIAFKAHATRQMRQDNCWRHDYSPWEKGSK